MLRNITVAHRKILCLRQNRALGCIFVTQLNSNSVFIKEVGIESEIPQYQIGKKMELLPLGVN